MRLLLFSNASIAGCSTFCVDIEAPGIVQTSASQKDFRHENFESHQILDAEFVFNLP